MQKFAFRLASVLEYRKTQLKLAQAQFSRLSGELSKLHLEREAIIETRRDALTSIEQAATLEMVDVRSLSAFLVGATARDRVLVEQIGYQKSRVEAQRARVIEAEREVKLLENFREKRRAEWNHAFDRELQTAAEEAWSAANFHAYDGDESAQRQR